MQSTFAEMLMAIQKAIPLAWNDTRQQVQEFDPRIRHTCFGQFLLGNVMHRVHELNSDCPSVRVNLKLNRRKSAYHVELTTDGFLLHISAVRYVGDLPRFAYFREAIAHSLQSFFAFTEEERAFKFYPPSPLDDSVRSYVQVLHGPKDVRENREELGFIRVAFLDRLREEQWRITTIDRLLEALSDARETDDSRLQDLLRTNEVPTEEIPDLVTGQFSLLSQEVNSLSTNGSEGA